MTSTLNQTKIAERFRSLAFGNLTCLGRHTISGMLTASGNQFMDWTSSYDMFSQQRLDIGKLFDVSLTSTIEKLDPTQMIIGHMDDTLVKKTGKKIPGTAWRRDPLGPPFHTNFIWGQRFIQVSLALPDDKSPGQSRAIPINFHHCPTVKKPNKTASCEQINTFKEHQKQAKLSRQGSLQIKLLRDKLDQQGHDKRILCMGVDGSYTNKTILKSLPDKVTLIGRIRKDCKLYEIPEQFDSSKSKGRKKVYGERVPVPEQIRQSDEYEWQKVKAWAVGKEHEFNVKIVKDLKWRSAGELHTLQLMVIKPLGYRPNKTSKILYREPAYLICTDNNLNAQELLQAYIWRWEIEVNIRDEKTLLGCGQAQVRNEYSAADVPAFVTAMYSFLLLANYTAFKDKDRSSLLPRPKWYPAKATDRFTTGDLVNHLRTELWAKGLGTNFSSFVKKEHQSKSRRNKSNSLSGALFYSRK